MRLNGTVVAALTALVLSASAGMAATVLIQNNGGATMATGVSDSLAGFNTAASLGVTTETVSDPNRTRSPFEGTGMYGDNYFNIANGGYLDVLLNVAMAKVSFLWGSPDSYNYVQVFLSDSTSQIFSLGNIPTPPPVDAGLQANYVTFTAIGGARITGVNFSTSGTAFELSNIVSAVPVPAGGLLLLSGLAGFAAVRRFKKSA